MPNNESHIYRTIMADQEAIEKIVQADNDEERIQLINESMQRLGMEAKASTVLDMLRHSQGKELSEETLEQIAGGSFHEPNNPGIW